MQHSPLKFRITRHHVILLFFLCAHNLAFSQSFWVPTNGPYNSAVIDLVKYNSGPLLAATGVQPSLSTDDGATWQVMKDLENEYNPTSFASSDGITVISLAAGFPMLYISQDSGHRWKVRMLDSFLYSSRAPSMDSSGTIYLPGDFALGVSSDTGKSWQIHDSLRYSSLVRVSPRGNVIALRNGTINGVDAVVFISINRGRTWTKTSFPEPIVSDLLPVHDSLVLAASNTGLYKSTDGAFHWTRFVTHPFVSARIDRLSYLSNRYLIASRDDSIAISTDNGESWVLSQIGAYAWAQTHVVEVDNGDWLVGSGYRGLFKSSDSGRHWERKNVRMPGDYVRMVINHQDGSLIANTSMIPYYSTNKGEIWNIAGSNFQFSNIYVTTSTVDSELLLSTKFTGYFKSNDNGRNWQQIEPAATHYVRSCLEKTSQKDEMYSVLATHGGLTVSTDRGIYWNHVPFFLLYYTSTFKEGRDGNYYTGMYSNSIFRSTDHGGTWEAISPQFSRTRAIHADSRSNIYAGTDSGLYRSTDNGATWIHDTTVIPPRFVQFIYIDRFDNVYVNTEIKQLFRTTDRGATWENITSGLPGVAIGTTTMDEEGYLYTNDFDAVYRSRTPVTSLHPVSSPSSLSLSPAYPNPVTSTATIEYALPARQYVTLELYNALGQKVQSLYSGVQEPGAHTAQMDAAGLPTGLYRCVLRSGDGAVTRAVAVRR